MRGARRTAVVIAACAALLVLPVSTAVADDPTPAPTLPAPVPTVAPTVAPTPVAPTTPPAAAKPPAPTSLKLPLKMGQVGPMVGQAQERLQWLGYRIGTSNTSTRMFGNSTQTIVKRFQAKYWLPATGVIDGKTWVMLKSMADPVGVLPRSCTDVPIALCADKTSKIIRYVVKGTVKLTLDARFGLPGMDTGNGTFTVKRKSRDHISTAYHTWMPYAMFFNGGEAVHYSPYFARDGYNGGSHGCIGVRDIKAAAWLFDRVPIGARVYVYYS